MNVWMQSLQGDPMSIRLSISGPLRPRVLKSCIVLILANTAFTLGMYSQIAAWVRVKLLFDGHPAHESDENEASPMRTFAAS